MCQWALSELQKRKCCREAAVQCAALNRSLTALWVPQEGCWETAAKTAPLQNHGCVSDYLCVSRDLPYKIYGVARESLKTTEAPRGQRYFFMKTHLWSVDSRSARTKAEGSVNPIAIQSRARSWSCNASSTSQPEVKQSTSCGEAET